MLVKTNPDILKPPLKASEETEQAIENRENKQFKGYKTELDKVLKMANVQ